MAVVVGTWSFSLEAVKLISDKLREGSGCLDALEIGVNGNYSHRIICTKIEVGTLGDYSMFVQKFEATL